MNAEIQFVDMDVIEHVEEYLQTKLDQLGKKYDWIIYAHVFLKKVPDPREKNKLCEIRLSTPGPLIFAHESDFTFELAIAAVIKQLEILLEKRKAKMYDHF